MPLTDAGALVCCKLVMGDVQTIFNATNARLGVGDSTAAFAKAQTDLQSASNKQRVGMDATFPKRTGSTLQFSATYSTAQGNYAWNEWGVFNNATPGAGEMLSRKVEPGNVLGTKPNTQTWQLVADCVFGA